MKPENLSDAMQFLNDSTLTETAHVLKKRPLNPRWFALAAAAACICIAVLLAVPTLTGQLPSAAPGSDSMSDVHGDSTLQGESTPSPASGTDSANTPGTEDTPPPTPGPDSAAPTREDLDPAYIASVLNGGIPAHGAVDPALPTITLDANSFASGGMGFEGYLAYDISELENGGPWRLGDAIDTLPVYRNPWARNEFEVVENADLDAMYARLYEVAALLGIDKAQISNVREYPPNESAREAYQYKYGLTEEEVPRGFFLPYWVETKLDGIELEVRSSFVATIQFDPTLPLPEGYDLSFFAARSDVETAGAYLLEQYRALMGYETPAVAIDGGDRNIYGEQGYDLRIYEASEDSVRDLENYWLDFWHFIGGDDPGDLWLIRHYHCDRSEKLGDYPIITPAEAWQMLQDGSSITTVPVSIPENAFPARVDLLYRNSASEQVFMPYYRFLIELPDMAQGDLKNYGTYYVPAVQSEYLNVLPVWDGSFN